MIDRAYVGKSPTVEAIAKLQELLSLRGEWMLYCCNKYFSNTEKRYLLDTAKKHNQILEYGLCPRCNILKACLTYTNNLGERREDKPKKRKAKQFIEACLSQPYYELKDLKIKFGTKNNMFWLFQTDGTIKDFNNQTKGSCNTEINIIQNTSDAPKTGALL